MDYMPGSVRGSMPGSMPDFIPDSIPDSMSDSIKSCFFSCSFTLCKTYTYFRQCYDKYLGECIHYYTNNDIDLTLPFYNSNGEQFYINSLVTANNSVLSTMNKSTEFILCDFTFLNITVAFNDEEYQIELANTFWDFYCVNNVIDFDFLYWYMTYINNVGNFDHNYSWVILDNNFDFIQLDSNSSILFHLDSYSIINNY
jgi:hypothetical protein|uniref:Uncharacterized protein n=1 Tax=viral metagenome TaxID=1070528 RepID=A0A6C0BX01_9ZZZZ